MAVHLPGGYSLRPMLHRWRGVKLGRNVWISQSVYLDELYPEAIAIGDNTTIGLRTSVFAHFHWGPKLESGGFKPVIIGADVFIGPHCVILPGVRIGPGSVIKAGSVVSRNVPPRVLWGDAGPGALAIVTVPLTPVHSYDEFTKGLRPLPANIGQESSPLNHSNS
jgi:NDP-sugar pyrophosphorylase family protein